MTTPDLTGADWRKSRHSQQNGACVEIARNLPGVVAIRDSKHQPGGPALTFAPAGFGAFLAGVTADGFRRP
jgi:hypothetical protein